MHGVFDELIAVDLLARQSEEDISRLDATAVRVEAKDRAQPLLGAGARTFEQLRNAKRHESISFWKDPPDFWRNDLLIKQSLEIRGNTKHGCHTLHNPAGQRPGVPAGGGAGLWVLRLRLVHHDNKRIARVIEGESRGKKLVTLLDE